MESNSFDLVIIGGGIVGSSLFSAAVLSGIKTVLLEAGSDVGEGASKANSGIVHAGYDPMPNTLMAKFNVEGSKMYESQAKRLGVPYVKCGTLVVTDESGKEKIEMLLSRGIKNGVEGLKILNREQLLCLEPNLSDNISVGLFAGTGAIICPYSTCIALVEEGMINGGTCMLNFEVDDIKQENDLFTVRSGKQCVYGKYVVNCAGVNAAYINSLAGAKEFKLNFVKGEYLLLDKSQKGFVSRPIFPLPTKDGKGILANTTVHGNILFGPTATPCQKEDTSVSNDGINTIKEKVVLSVKKPNFKKTIKLFAGVRAKCGEDFVVEKDENIKNFYYTMGICSPGLSSAPAIAKYLLNLLKEDGIKTTKIVAKQRVPYVNMQELTKAEAKQMIKKNPLYGKIVCRCEHISEGEIIDALNSPLKPKTIDGIKRRVRPTMGRCQGSFCVPKLIKIIAKQNKIEEEEVTQKGEGSELLVSNIKEGGIYGN